MSDAAPANARTVRVELGARSYDIVIGRGLIETAGREIASRLPGVRAAIVTDETVPLTPGNRMRLANVPPSFRVYNVEMQPGQGGKLARSAGNVG